VMADEPNPFISDSARTQWGQWCAEYREKIAPLAIVAGVGPDAFCCPFCCPLLSVKVRPQCAPIPAHRAVCRVKTRPNVGTVAFLGFPGKRVYVKAYREFEPRPIRTPRLTFRRQAGRLFFGQLASGVRPWCLFVANLRRVRSPGVCTAAAVPGAA
jgi:hypothetical protein